MELKKTANNGGKKLTWTRRDEIVLIHRYCTSDYRPASVAFTPKPFNRIHAMMVTADTDINWDLLAESYNHSWSACSLEKKWTTLKRGVDGSDGMNHQGSFSLSFKLRFYMIYWGPRDRVHTSSETPSRRFTHGSALLANLTDEEPYPIEASRSLYHGAAHPKSICNATKAYPPCTNTSEPANCWQKTVRVPSLKTRINHFIPVFCKSAERRDRTKAARSGCTLHMIMRNNVQCLMPAFAMVGR